MTFRGTLGDVHVLVIDDNVGVRDALTLLFRVHGIDVRTASSPEEALAAVADDDLGVVVQDMNFRTAATSGEEGIALFHALRERNANLPIIILTAWIDLETAVSLVREGADDYMGKPWDDDKLLAKVKRLLAARSVRRERGTGDLAGLVYASPAMHSVVSLALRVAPTDASVLITGPSGSGKERIAALIVKNSARRDPFIAVNAGALPPGLLEAELFGAEAGAFTGATGRRVGRFEAADRGTLFLDEVGLLSPTGQAALLRVVQSGEYQRLGSSATRHCDVRVLAATNENLAAAIEAGTFREDLYYRLAVIELAIPPLCERPEDIESLAEHFLQQHGLDADALDASARRAMREHPWPGNVRELENRVQRAVVTRAGARIGVPELGLSKGLDAPGPAPKKPAGEGPDRAEVERALREADGVVSRAAEALGLSRQALYRRMDRLGFKVERRFK